MTSTLISKAIAAMNASIPLSEDGRVAPKLGEWRFLNFQLPSIGATHDSQHLRSSAMNDQLTIAIVAAGAAISGALLSQISAAILQKLERGHKREVLLRTKFEELAGHLNSTLEWVAHAGRSTTREELHARGQPISARQVCTLTMIFFPDLRPTAQALLSACTEHQCLLIETFRSGTGATAAGQAATHDPDGFRQATQALLRTRQALDDAIVRLAPIYASA